MYKKYFKRFFDFVMTLVLLLCLSPIILVVMVLLHFANKGAGIFFYQERPGLKGNIFKIIKFKSMTDERDADGNMLPPEQRITKIGSLIRKTSLDELPQLFNVLKGDMSLIGPRPLMPHYLQLYSKEQMRRHDVRPGITGWAQVNGRNSITWTKKFELDVWYVDHVSFLLDLRIFWLTIKKILGRKDINSPDEKVGSVGFRGYN